MISDASEHHARVPTVLEAVMQSVYLPTVLLLLFLSLASWAWIVAMARDMRGPMTGAGAWMMTATWDLPHVLLLWAMWAVMMTAMMLPSAIPTVLLYGAMTRRSPEPGAAWRIYALAAGYLTAWAAFSVGATAMQRVLARLLFVTPMMELNSSDLGGGLLLLAGAYQLTPMKQACLRTCQSPLGFLMSRWRSGLRGAFRMGLSHGFYCVGCCWALMLILFAGGVMNLWVIAALAGFVAFEKLAPVAARGRSTTGILLLLFGSWMIVR